MKKLKFMFAVMLGLGLAQLTGSAQAEDVEEIASARKALPGISASQCITEVDRVLNEEDAYNNVHNRIIEGDNIRLILYGGDDNGENHEGGIVLSCFEQQLIVNVYRQEVNDNGPSIQDFMTFIQGKIFPNISSN